MFLIVFQDRLEFAEKCERKQHVENMLGKYGQEIVKGEDLKCIESNGHFVITSWCLVVIHDLLYFLLGNINVAFMFFFLL